MTLSFETLRLANRLRLPQFKNNKSEPAHSKEDGSDWTPSDWLEALVGEIGEYANWHKKFKRGDITFYTFREEAEKELADIQTYLDILAMRCLDIPGHPHATGIFLDEATRYKFNEVSKRVQSSIRITEDDRVAEISKAIVSEDVEEIGIAGLIANEAYLKNLYQKSFNEAMKRYEDWNTAALELGDRKNASNP